MKHVHFIGICGVAMSALAIAFKKNGHEKLPDGRLVPSFEVSGSDAGFFPPVSTNLKKQNIQFYPGWHPDLMIKDGEPDLVIVGNVASSTNPEWLYAQKNKLNYKSYPEAIAEYFVKENSIVCAGTYGKTSTSALLSWILIECGYNPSYMFGGLAIDENFLSARIVTEEPRKAPPHSAGSPRGNYSVIEGDEYKSSKWDNDAKFFHYHPTHLLLTAVEWDHADVYATEESYFKAFEKLVKMLPGNGLIVKNEKIADFKFQNAKCVTYGQSEKTDYKYFEVINTKDGIKFKINHNSEIYNLQSAMLGDYWVENITGVFAMAHQIGIEPEKIISAISKFKGLKRRLEKRFERKITVFDDIAHSPAKAKSALETLRRHSERLICIFEPNTGNRQPQSAPSYSNAFADADEVIIPRLTKLKTADNLHHFEGDELAKVIGKTHNNVKYIDDDKELTNYLVKNTASGDVVVFCGSHGFRGMIDELVNKLVSV